MRISKSKKRILFLIPIALAIIISVIFATSSLLKKSHQLSDLEKISFQKETAPVADYLEAIDNTIESAEPSQIDKYVVFALLYSANENNRTELTIDEIKAIIHDHFTVDTSVRPLETMGITPSLTTYRITHNSDQGTYSINLESDRRTAARTPITKYILKDIQKSANIYTATYAKYVANDPYAIFNFASEHNLSNSEISNYLKGDGKSKALKTILTADNIDDLASYEKDLTATYELDDSKLRLKEIH